MPALPGYRRQPQVIAPDVFVRAQIDLDRDLVYAAVTRIADSLRHPPGTIADVLA